MPLLHVRKQVMRSVVRLIERVTATVGYAVALLVIPLALAMGYEVFARYLFGAPTIWAYEIGYMIMGVHFLLGSAFTLQRRGHVRVDLIYAGLSPKKKAWIDLVVYVFFLLPFLVLLTTYLWDYAYRAFETGERTGSSAWSPIIWPLRMCYVAAFALLALQVVAEIIKAVRVVAGHVEESESRG